MAREYSNRKHYIKDKKITILEGVNQGPLPDEYTWRPIKNGENVWAYYRQATVNEHNNATLAGYDVEAIFRVNWRDNIHMDNRIDFRGERYEIIRIDDFEGYKKDLTIYAKHYKGG